MAETIGISIVISLAIIILGIGFLNKLGIIPVINFGTVAKIFIILVLVFVVLFTIKGCKDNKAEGNTKASSSQTVKSDTQNILGIWKSSQDFLAIDETSISGLFDEIGTVNYKITAENTLTFFDGAPDNGKELLSMPYSMPDKNTLILIDSTQGKKRVYSRSSRAELDDYFQKVKQATSSGNLSSPSTDSEQQEQSPEGNVMENKQPDDSEPEAQPIEDSFDFETAKQNIQGTWENTKTKKTVQFTDMEMIPEILDEGITTTYSVESENMLRLIEKDYRAEISNQKIKFKFFNDGQILELHYIKDSNEDIETYTKIN